MDRNGTLVNIIKLCTKIKKNSSQLFSNLAEKAKKNSLKKFWKNISETEKKHNEYLVSLQNFADKSMIKKVFQNSFKVEKELKNRLEESKEILNESQKRVNTKKSLFLFFYMQYLLLHIAFEILFNLYKVISGKSLPETSFKDQMTEILDESKDLFKEKIEIRLFINLFNEIKEKNEFLIYQNYFDQETGVLNRRGFFQNLRPLSFLAMRNNYNVALMLVDIGDFINFQGDVAYEIDVLMRSVANSIKKHIRRSDIVGRFTEDIFIVYLSQVDKKSLEMVAKKIQLFAKKENLQKRNIRISIGAAQAKIRENPVERINYLMKCAREALDIAKSTGENKITVCEEFKV